MSEWWTYRPEDFLLFSPRAYWRLFELHNAAVWPLHFLTLPAGAAIFILILRRPPHHGRWISILLALICILVGWLFLWNRYAAINWAMEYIAPLFALEALTLVIVGTGFDGLSFDRRGFRGRTGLLLAAIGLVAYPFFSLLFGRPWTEVEVFGVAPDPSMVALLGFLLAARGRLLFLLLPIPLLWLLLSAATLATMREPQAWLPLLSAALALAAMFLHATVGRSAEAAGARGLPECPGQDQRRLHPLPRSLSL